jgi:hypothetical protein
MTQPRSIRGYSLWTSCTYITHTSNHDPSTGAGNISYMWPSAPRLAAPAAGRTAEFAAQVPAARARLPAAHYTVRFVLLLCLGLRCCFAAKRPCCSLDVCQRMHA